MKIDHIVIKDIAGRTASFASHDSYTLELLHMGSHIWVSPSFRTCLYYHDCCCSSSFDFFFLTDGVDLYYVFFEGKIMCHLLMVGP